MASTNIYSEINNELTKPIFVSLTMANDSFLKEWLQDKENIDDPQKNINEIRDYLLGMKSKYQYNSVFVVSEKTKRYYHYKGLSKVVSETDDHDQWYYNFRDTNKSYELDVDTDEADNHKLTVFFNCRIEDEMGNLMGVAGVGVDIHQIQSTIDYFQNTYNLETYLVDSSGTIQVHARTDYIEKANLFDVEEISEYKEQIIKNKDSLEIVKYNKDLIEGYYITKYIDELDWYLVVKNDTSILKESFIKQLLRDFIITGIVLAFILVFISRLIHKNQKGILNMAKTDILSNLPNRRAFNEEIENALSESDRDFYAFIFDIDQFKELNDQYGHLLGDQILKTIGRVSSEKLGESTFVCRWGGDEFAGIIYGSGENALNVLETFNNYILANDELKKYNIRLSMGYSKAMTIDTYDTLMSRVDKGLYEAKESDSKIIIK